MDSNNNDKRILETILLAGITEQRRARRWKIFFRLIWLIIIIVIISTAFSNSDYKSDLSKNKKEVAVINLTGVISNENDTYKAISKSLNKALKDKNTVAVIIRANSPGGSPVYSDMLYNEILRLKKLYPKKPIDFVIEEMCASGCYYIASASNKIYANPASIVGSIGVIYMGFGANNLINKLGIDSRLLISGKNKAMGYPFIPANKEQEKMQQQMLDEIHEQFIASVKNGRGKRLNTTNLDLFSGRYWIGKDALKLGLIDGFSTVDILARDQYKTDNIVDFTETDSKYDKILKSLGEDVVDGAKQSITNSNFGFIQ